MAALLITGIAAIVAICAVALAFFIHRRRASGTPAASHLRSAHNAEDEARERPVSDLASTQDIVEAGAERASLDPAPAGSEAGKNEEHGSFLEAAPEMRTPSGAQADAEPRRPSVDVSAAGGIDEPRDTGASTNVPLYDVAPLEASTSTPPEVSTSFVPAGATVPIDDLMGTPDSDRMRKGSIEEPTSSHGGSGLKRDASVETTMRERGCDSSTVSGASAAPSMAPIGGECVREPLAREPSEAPLLPATPKTPRQFRPTVRSPVRARTPSRDAAATTRPVVDRALPILVRLTFEKGGYCRISLLARRLPEYPQQIEVTGTGNPEELLALQESWFQDVVPADAGGLLRDGIEWLTHLPDGRSARWSLGGREIYVFAPHDELAAFVSTTRLVIGEQHVVLCTRERLRDVSDAIARTGTEVPEPLSGKGLPEGWLAFRGIVPKTPVVASGTGDILDALCPLAEVEISLEAGIRLERQAWLESFPPRIRLRGDVGSAGTVFIDGTEASVDSSGAYVVPGWDRPGEHSVSCASGSRSYSIRSGAEQWEEWDAYAWPQAKRGSSATPLRPTICGVLVRPPSAVGAKSRSVIVPASNSLLLGRNAGEIARCMPRAELTSSTCIGFPPFEPVWAVPADALRTDKRSVHILLIGRHSQPQIDAAISTAKTQPRVTPAAQRRVDTWRDAILNASRKGLSTELGAAEAEALWRAYQAAARSLRRRR